MSLIFFLLIGLCAGWLAGKITSGKGFGPLGNLIVGVIGALLGGFLGRLIGLAATGILGQLFLAVIGAVLLVALVPYVFRKR